MEFNNILNLISNSRIENWQGISRDKSEYYFFKLDVNLRIEYEYDYEQDSENRSYFDEEWANKFSHSGQRADRAMTYVYYNSTLIYECHLVNAIIPSSRISIPFPSENMTISTIDYKIASILDTQNHLNEWLKEFGIQVI